MQSSDPSSSNDHVSGTDDASRDVNVSATTSGQNIIGIQLDGNSTLTAKRDVNVTIGRIISKEEHWQNLTSGTGDVQKEAAARVLDLACDDEALAEKLKQLLETEATPINLKLVILRTMKAYRWLERPPKPLMQSLERLSKNPEDAIRLLVTPLLRNYSSLPEK